MASNQTIQAAVEKFNNLSDQVDRITQATVLTSARGEWEAIHFLHRVLLDLCGQIPAEAFDKAFASAMTRFLAESGATTTVAPPLPRFCEADVDESYSGACDAQPCGITTVCPECGFCSIHCVCGAEVN